MLVPPHYLVSTAFKKMRWKDEFRKWLPKLSNIQVPRTTKRCTTYSTVSNIYKEYIAIYLKSPHQLLTGKRIAASLRPVSAAIPSNGTLMEHPTHQSDVSKH